MSNYLDYLIGNVMGNALKEAMPINVSFLSEYPDFFAFGMVILLAILLSIGVKESTLLNNVFTAVNLITISVIIVAGSMNGNEIHNCLKSHSKLTIFLKNTPQLM